jgi:hypothetical protein
MAQPILADQRLLRDGVLEVGQLPGASADIQATLVDHRNAR